jgi:E3 ubiquitin-protein ligase HERC2
MFFLYVLQRYRIIEIAIRQCRSSGIDCKVHGLKIRGRLRNGEDEPTITVSYLASDVEDDASAEDKCVTVKSLDKVFKRSSGKEIQTHVFVWGLNDKDQLGGPRGSKVCAVTFTV